MQSVTLITCAMAALWAAQAPVLEQKAFHAWAPTPPMGWNSWDCFGATVTEEQTKAAAGAGWGETRVGKNASGQNLVLGGKPVAFGIGTHAPSVLEYDLPSGYETFKATGVLDPGSRGRGSVQFAVYSEEAIVPVRETATVAVSLADMGLAGPVWVRDLWTHTDLVVFEKTFAREIRFHGAGLYRLSPESAARR